MRVLDRLLRRSAPAPATLPEAVRAYLDAPSPPNKLLWKQADYAVIDVETTGLDPKTDSLLAIGLVPVAGGRVRLDQAWYTLVQPRAGAQFKRDAVRVHGLMPSHFLEAPTPEIALVETLRRLTGRVLIVHVSSVDIGFMNAALRPIFNTALRGPAVDTARLASTLHRNDRLLGGIETERPAIQLRSLSEAEGLPVYGEHNALNDCITTAQLFLAQSHRLEAQGMRTLKDLLGAGRCL